MPTARPPLGPGLMTNEHELAAFDGLGLDDVATRHNTSTIGRTPGHSSVRKARRAGGR
ncbi:hypothetical protein [Streptomyces sp. NPDC048639]|uniref:hypothetical protein n=1 Tax=Streptomyces sp. NPDC048639 TaxID=3365581 RepID=UPI0037181CD7